MAKFAFWSRLKKSLLKSRRHSTKGFTLLELLVVTAIAGGIVAGLTYIVVQMMTADQREASRSETQREMQLALDYISAELREAVYVYPGDYLECSGSPGGSCQSFSQFLPASVSQNSVPVLAFWKQQAFPDPIKTQCASAAQNGIACLAGQSYALVVYSLAKNDSSPTWKGKARITRYVLSQFNSAGQSNTGYVDPGLNRNFTTWPYGNNASGAFTNLQAGTPTGSADTLVDYVGFDYLDTGVSNDLGQTGFCPDLPTETGKTDQKEYNISPSNTMLNNKAGFAGVRSFYACVAAPTQSIKQGASTVTVPDSTSYRDIIVYLRGSATGRAGILADKGGQILKSRDEDILPTLQTRVLSRSILGRSPAD